MYGKIFDSIYRGTLYGHWEAIVTLEQMVILCDADGVLDMTPQSLAATTSIPLEIIEKGLRVLQDPDPHSRTEGEDGRRIILLDDRRPWGWFIVNHKKYKELRDYETVRAQTRERVRRHRDKKKMEAECNAPVTPRNARKRHTNTYTYTDTDTDIKSFCPNSVRLAILLAELILIHTPNHRELRKNNRTATIARWARDINRMVRLDGADRTFDEIERRIIFSAKDSFWYKNILSGNSLRKHFDRLGMEMNKLNREQHEKHAGIDEWLKETYHDRQRQTEVRATDEGTGGDVRK